MADLQTGKRRNIKEQGRDPKHFRSVRLLSHGIDARLDPSRWNQTHGVKRFDATSTAILRVQKHKTQDAYLVYGMRAENGENGKANIKVEAYDLISVAEGVPGVAAKVAGYCGLPIDMVAELGL